MGDICMSDKERRRLGVMVMVESGDLKLTDASEILGVSYRQVKQIRKQYCEEGDIGLVHRSQGSESRTEAIRKIIRPSCLICTISGILILDPHCFQRSSVRIRGLA